RPMSASLEEQIARIPSGQYRLRDDDRMTGSTLAAVRAMLPERIRVTDEDVSLALDREEDEEVVDSRDFLLGADEGGLVVELPNSQLGRAPYLLPYADPSVRASVRADQVVSFSIRVWLLNQGTFHNTGLRIRDLPSPARIVMSFLGEERLLEHVCEWHIEQ